MTAIVFAGPSLYGVDTSAFPNCRILPPASRGDLYRQAERSPRSICLVDGTFEHHPAVWHKEILYALSKGIEIIGAASMGALRGAECARFGMVGLGRIFRDYQSGRRVSDADVAVLHGPEEMGFMPLTLSLVDAENAALLLFRRGQISRAITARLLGSARSIFYKERTWQQITAKADLDAADRERILELCLSCPSLKQLDAVLALDHVNAGRIMRPRTSMAIEHFQKSQFFCQMAFDMHRTR
jgi:hypothetical protein